MLVDTHILLWTLEGIAGHMGPKTVTRMQQNFDDTVVSSASLFEIKMKQRRGGLPQFNIGEIIEELQSRAISILDVNAQQLLSIPNRDITEHADSFDLLLIAQAITENIPFLTCDAKIQEISFPGLRLVDGRQ